MKVLFVIMCAYMLYGTIATVSMAMGSQAGTLAAVVFYFTMWPVMVFAGILYWYLKERQTYG
jgi:hypothetical protein